MATKRARSKFLLREIFERIYYETQPPPIAQLWCGLSGAGVLVTGNERELGVDGYRGVDSDLERRKLAIRLWSLGRNHIDETEGEGVDCSLERNERNPNGLCEEEQAEQAMLSDDRVEESLVDLDECLEHADDGDSINITVDWRWVIHLVDILVDLVANGTQALGDFWTLDEHIDDIDIGHDRVQVAGHRCELLDVSYDDGSRLAIAKRSSGEQREEGKDAHDADLTQILP